MNDFNEQLRYEYAHVYFNPNIELLTWQCTNVIQQNTNTLFHRRDTEGVNDSQWINNRKMLIVYFI